MRGFMRPLLVIAAALALTGTAIGIVAAQDTGEATPTDEVQADVERPDFAGLLAENLGISREELEAAIQQTRLDIVDDLLARGVIDEEQAAAMRERIESGEGPGFGFGRGFKHGFHRGFGVGASLEELAEFLGLELTELREARETQSLAEIAAEQGIGEDELSAYLLAEIKEKVNEAVANERISQEKADEILANAPDRVAELIDRVGRPDRPFRGRPGMDTNGTVVPPPADGASIVF